MLAIGIRLSSDIFSHSSQSLMPGISMSMHTTRNGLVFLGAKDFVRPNCLPHFLEANTKYLGLHSPHIIVLESVEHLIIGRVLPLRLELVLTDPQKPSVGLKNSRVVPLAHLIINIIINLVTSISEETI